MVVLHHLPRRPLRLPPPAVALGIFDGVHPGHRAILRKAASIAKSRGGTPAAVTFDPHPLAVLQPALAPPMLMPLERRLEAFTRCGIRLVLVVPFSRSFSRWSPERFVEEILVGKLGARDVVVGYNFRFGAGRSGTVALLRRLGRRHGFRVHVISPVRSGGARISSGKLRNWLREGKLDRVRRLMGGPPVLVGKVIKGKGRGAGLGFATANLQLAGEVLPPVGVYAVRARIVNKRTGYKVPGTSYAGMANLGFRPTFGPASSISPLLEVHLFAKLPRLYGKSLQVEFLRRLRAEKKFDSPRSLAAQLKKDAARARLFALHASRRMV